MPADVGEFREVYKGFLIEAEYNREGGVERSWIALVERQRTSPSGLTTSTFMGPLLALEAARREVDKRIAAAARHRVADPPGALAAALKDVARVQDLLTRVRAAAEKTRQADHLQLAEDLARELKRAEQAVVFARRAIGRAGDCR